MSHSRKVRAAYYDYVVELAEKKGFKLNMKQWLKLWNFINVKGVKLWHVEEILKEAAEGGSPQGGKNQSY
jgi:hypothetical protein